MAEEQKIRADDRSSAARYRALLENMHGGVFLAEVGADVRVNLRERRRAPMVEENGRRERKRGKRALHGLFRDLPLLLAALRGTAQSGENSELSYRVGAREPSGATSAWPGSSGERTEPPPSSAC